MIKAVTFDFWNTLAHVSPSTMDAARRRAVAGACADCGVEVESVLLTAALDEVGLQYQRFWEEGRHFHPDEGAEMLVRVLGIEEFARQQVAEAFLGAGREVDLMLAPDLEPCLRTLQGQGIRLGIVCDVVYMGGDVLRELLEDKDLLRFFSGWGFSDEVGSYKPAPEIFEATLGALGVKPQEALHVGDLRRTDIAGAASLGMKASRYRGLYDDPDHADGLEAEFVIDNHSALPELVERLRSNPQGVRSG